MLLECEVAVSFSQGGDLSPFHLPLSLELSCFFTRLISVESVSVLGCVCNTSICHFYVATLQRVG